MDLPSVAQLHTSVPSLPKDVSRVTQRIFPSNGSVFGPNSNITFDLPNTGSLVPESMTLYFQYNVSVTGTASANSNSAIIDAPAYSVFRQLDTMQNGTMLQSITNYHQVAKVLLKTRMDLAARAAASVGLGITGYALNSVSPPVQGFENLNSALLPATTTASTVISCAQPVINLFTCSDKLIPLFAVGACRMTFWTNPNSEFIVVSNNQVITYTLQNVSLVFDTVEMGQAYRDMVMAQGPAFCRSTHYSVVTQALAASAGAGNIDLVFQNRLSSIRAAYLVATSSGRSGLDFFSVTGMPVPGSTGTPGGRVTFNLGGYNYPQSGIDLNQPASILDNLRVAAHSTGHSQDSFGMSIPWIEFVAQATVTPLAGFTVSPLAPATFILGQSLEKIGAASGFLVNGTSSQSAPILVRFTTQGATLAYNCSLICAADAIITFDSAAKTVTVDI